MRRIGAGGVVGAMVMAATMASGAPAGAVTTVVVTTTADVVNGGDGLTSLREAVSSANADGDDTVIQLAAGQTYQLTICEAKEPIELGMGFFVPPDDDDANVDGDLDHTEANTLTIEGAGSTVENTCLYDRVVHNVHADSWLTLDDVTISGGDSPPDSGTNIWSPGGAALDGVTVTDGVSTLGGQSAAVVVGESVPDNLGLRLTMTNSSILGNGPGGVRVTTSDAVVTDSFIADSADGAGFTITFGTLTMTGTSLVDNNGNGVSGIDAALHISDSAAGGNSGVGFRDTGNAESGQPLELINVNAVQNFAGGVECSYCTDLDITSSTISHNSGTGVAMLTNVVGPEMTITNTEITDNDASAGGFNPGGGVYFEADPSVAPEVTITRSTIAGNVTDTGADGGGVSLVNASLDIDTSTISGNTASGDGGGIAMSGDDPVDLDFVTLVDNTSAGGASNLQRDTGALTATATVIALGSGGPNCAGGPVAVSNGGNQVDDLSCGLDGGPGDAAPSGNPLLGSLDDNGGPTPTRLPLDGSPLLGAVSGPLCDAAEADQRGISRPQGDACEPGAVEENELLLAMLVVGSDDILDPDVVWQEWLLDHDYVVELVDDDDLAAAALGDADLVVVSSSVVTSKVGSDLNGLAVPMIVTEGYLLDDLGMATASGETASTTRQVDVVDSSSGLSGRVTVLSSPRRLAYGQVGGDAHVIALSKVSGDPPVVFVYEAADELADGSAAAGPRAAFLFDYTAPLVARSQAFVLLDHVHDLVTD